MRSMAIVTTTRHGAVRLKLPYSVLSDGMPCVRVRVQSTSPAYSECPRHRVNPCQEGHAPSDKSPKTASCATLTLTSYNVGADRSRQWTGSTARSTIRDRYNPSFRRG